MRRPQSWLISLALVNWLLLLSVSSAEAAAPQIILVHGGGLQEPVVLDDWLDNFWLLLGEEAGEQRAPLDGRPYFELGLRRAAAHPF
jgi:hypothetical protein